MGTKVELRPTYWASFSGGKDSFYMIYYILNNLDRYPLDGIVHFELEIDFPFIKDVVDYVEAECKKYNIPMLRIKPRKRWIDLYNTEYENSEKYKKMMYPTRVTRWCNSRYKLDAERQLRSIMKKQGKKVISYIGFCADESKRFVFELDDRNPNVTQIYPLAENEIFENEILEWAKKQQIYNEYYKYNKRCGCMCCPMSSINNLAYTKEYYPEQYEFFMKLAIETEEERKKELGRAFSVWGSEPKYNTEYRMKRVDEFIANKKMKQLSIFDFIQDE